MKFMKVLVEQKEMILSHLVQEQNFKISLNSQDPKIIYLKSLFVEMEKYFSGVATSLKNDIKTNYETI